MDFGVYIKKLKDPIIFGTFIVTIGIFVSTIFSYLLQLYMGRLLTVSEYGSFNTLFALVNILSIPGAVLSTSLVKLASELKSEKNFDKLTHLFVKLSIYTSLFSVVMASLIYVLRGQLASYLNFSDTSSFLPFGLYLGLNFLSLIPLAYLQGLLRFKAYSFVMVSGGIARFVFPLALVLMGMSIQGVFIGQAVACILTYTISVLFLKSNLTSFNKSSLKVYYNRLLSFSVAVFFVSFGMTLLNNIDIIIVKKFFAEDIVGYYTGAVTVSKILLFGTSTVAVVMFPQISATFSAGQSIKNKFKMFLATQVLIVLGGTAVFMAFPKLITTLMFGNNFLPSVKYIPYYSAFVCLYVLVNFMTMYFLAIKKTKVMYIQLAAVTVQLALLAFLHRSLYEVIFVNTGVTFAMLLLLAVLYFTYARKNPAKFL